jgi:pyridoxal/pyridoxine/pyridoxamine kinase
MNEQMNACMKECSAGWEWSTFESGYHEAASGLGDLLAVYLVAHVVHSRATDHV